MDARLRCCASFSACPFNVTCGASDALDEVDDPAAAAEGAITSMSTMGAAAEDRPDDKAFEVVEYREDRAFNTA